MQLNNVTPTPPKTIADLVVGDAFFVPRLPDKVFVLVSLPPERPGYLGLVDFGPTGIMVYEAPPDYLTSNEVITKIQIQSLNFSEKK